MSDDTSDAAEKTDANAADKKDDNGGSQRRSIRPPKEIGGRDGPDPTRYGDWEKNGRCVDF